MAELAKFLMPLIVADCFLLVEDGDDEDASTINFCDERDLDDRRVNVAGDAFDSTTITFVKIPKR